jgi:ferritin-like protein
MASEGLHEPAESLKPITIDYHRAIVSLMEELEAVDWYNQRVDSATDEQLKEILAHNRDEEKEHASMVLEWLRRHDPTLSKWLKTYLFQEGSITGREKAETAGGGESGETDAAASDGSLGIGSLRAEKHGGSRGGGRSDG